MAWSPVLSLNWSWRNMLKTCRKWCLKWLQYFVGKKNTRVLCTRSMSVMCVIIMPRPRWCYVIMPGRGVHDTKIRLINNCHSPENTMPPKMKKKNFRKNTYINCHYTQETFDPTDSYMSNCRPMWCFNNFHIFSHTLALEGINVDLVIKVHENAGRTWFKNET